MDFHHKTLTIGHTLVWKNLNGIGLNRQCKLLLLTFAFEKLKIERVEFRADARNQRSLDVP